MSFKFNSFFTTVFAATMISLAPASAATLINFENGYSDDQVLGDGVALLDANGDTSNVYLSTANTNTMSIEASGGEKHGPAAFVNDPLGKTDVASANETSSLDGYFLRATESLNGDYLNYSSVFTLTFQGGASKVAAQIWDIDGNHMQGSEGWKIIATLTGGRTSQVDSPQFMNTSDAGSLNGQAWDFSFETAGNEILSLDFIFTGTKTRGIGVAFDNLTVATVPLPSAGFLLIAGIGALGAFRRRTSQQS